MTETEARQLVFALETIYHRSVGDGRDIWVRTFQRAEYAPAAAVLERWTRGISAPQYLPTLPEAMIAFRAEVKLAERDAAEEQGHRSPLIPPDVTEVPDWVMARQTLRAKGDMRALPEQEPGFHDNGYDWPPPEGVVDDAA